MKPTAKMVFDKLEELAPLSLAESWDNCGLQIGSCDQVVSGVVVTLDSDGHAVQAALESGANLIISHHPLFFKGLKRIDFATPPGALVKNLIKHDMTVYSAHTNLDSAPEGLNQFLAVKLGLTKIEPLGVTRSDRYLKLAVFVPESHLETVRVAVNDAGAGCIGNYRDCSFRTPGVGTFRPLEGSNPFLGKAGELEEVAEFRLEVIVPEELTDRVVNSMLEAHPYEEVAYDLIPLANSGPHYGLGRVGELPLAMSLEELADRIKEAWDVEALAVAGSPRGKIRRVGLASGSGASLIASARFAGCEVLITGDVKYHEARDAMECGLTLIDAGHDEMELAAVELMASYLERIRLVESWDIGIRGFRARPVWRRV